MLMYCKCNPQRRRLFIHRSQWMREQKVKDYVIHTGKRGRILDVGKSTVTDIPGSAARGAGTKDNYNRKPIQPRNKGMTWFQANIPYTRITGDNEIRYRSFRIVQMRKKQKNRTYMYREQSRRKAVMKLLTPSKQLLYGSSIGSSPSCIKFSESYREKTEFAELLDRQTGCCTYIQHCLKSI